MDFYSVRELRTKPRTIWADIKDNNEVVITNNGKPYALMINIPEGQFDEIVKAVRQARAMVSLNEMRLKASKNGFKSEDEIDDLISEIRLETKAEK